MKAEDVDVALVEKAARAIWEADSPAPELGWPHWDVAVERAANGLWDLPQMVADTRNLARHALAAVLPEIQAQALLDFAGPEGGDLEPHEFRDAANWGAWKARQAARYEAGRLTATTEGLTTCFPSLGEPCGSCHRCTETQGDGRG